VRVCTVLCRSLEPYNFLSCMVYFELLYACYCDTLSFVWIIPCNFLSCVVYFELLYACFCDYIYIYIYIYMCV